MIKQKIANFWLYQQRYRLAYGFLILSFLTILGFAIFVAPSGLTEGEISSATSSFNLNFGNIFSKEIINLPFKILQKISISIFGLGEFSIKLPAILLSILAIFLIIKLSHAWFGRGIATIAAILATASGQFFLISQSGAGEILQIIYPLALVLLGFEFIRKRQNWTFLAIAAILAASLYSPLGFFLTASTILAIFIHPTLRLMLNRTPRNLKLAAGGIFIAMILPILAATFSGGVILGEVFGFTKNFSLGGNFNLTKNRLFGFENQFSDGVILPIINPVTLILIALGIFFTHQLRHTAKSHLLYAWTVAILLACLANPAATVLLFVPILLLTTTGIYSLIQTWYTIFPKNPYARVFGLIPISVFLLGFMVTNLNNFKNNYLFSPEIGAIFSQDLEIVKSEISDKKMLVVSDQEKPFFEILSRQKNAKISTKIDGEEVIISKKFLEKNPTLPENYQVSKILTSSKKSNADRFYILKKR